MKEKRFSLALVIFSAVISLSLAGEDKCRIILERFSESSAKFTRCATQFSRPIKMCRECKEDFLDVRKYYSALEHAEEEGIVCKDLLTSQDKVEIIKETYNFIISSDGLWAKGFCSSCYTSPFNEESSLTNITKTFFVLYQTVSDCFSQYPSPGNGTGKSKACAECQDDYNDLQEFYKDYFLAQQFPELKYCYDVVDAMNSTQHHWGSGHYQCGRNIKASAPLITAVVIVLSSPVLLYLLAKFSPGTTTARERLVAQTNISGFLAQASNTAREEASRNPGHVGHDGHVGHGGHVGEVGEPSSQDI